MKDIRHLARATSIVLAVATGWFMGNAYKERAAFFVWVAVFFLGGCAVRLMLLSLELED